MHSKIIQVSRIPLWQDDYVEEAQFIEGGFCPWIADYVDGDLNDDMREHIIEDFLSRFGDNAIVITPLNNCAHGVHFEITEGYLESLRDKCLQGFKRDVANSESLSDLRYATANYLEDVFGTYVYEEGAGVMPVLRWLTEWADENTTYYIGGVIDYHW